MIKYLILFLPTVFILFFAFQNCQKPPYQDDLNALPTDAANIPLINKNEFDDKTTEQISKISLYDKMPVQMTHNSHTYTLLDRVSFKIDWLSGQIEHYSSQENLIAKYCLNEVQLTSLQSLFSELKLCRYSAAQNSNFNQICTQMIVPAYAKIEYQNQQIVAVGEASDGCGNNRIDFCDDRKTELAAWLSEFKQAMSSLKCQSK